MKNQIYIHKCPKCGREVPYRTKSAFDKAENEQSFCRNCRELEKGLAANYTRKCPVCGKEIKYKRKGDYN